MITTVCPSLTWKELPEHHEEICSRLSEILSSWEGTPHINGACCKGVGVDCINFVLKGVVDELYGYPRNVTRRSISLCLYSKEKADAALREILSEYQPVKRVLDKTIEPGDIIVTATDIEAPGHIMIAGPKQSELWHTYSSPVHRTGLGFFSGHSQIMNYYRTYRFQDKEKWVLPQQG